LADDRDRRGVEVGAAQRHARADRGAAFELLDQVAVGRVAGCHAPQRADLGAGHPDQQGVAAARVQPQTRRRGRAGMAADTHRRQHIGLDRRKDRPQLALAASAFTLGQRPAVRIEPFAAATAARGPARSPWPRRRRSATPRANSCTSSPDSRFSVKDFIPIPENDSPALFKQMTRLITLVEQRQQDIINTLESVQLSKSDIDFVFKLQSQS
jgi:hypothetical protein